MNYMFNKSKFLFPLIIAFFISVIFFATNKSYFTYSYKVNYIKNLEKYIDIKHKLVSKFLKKKHVTSFDYSRNYGFGSITIKKSFLSKNDDLVNNYTSLLISDVDELNIFINNFLNEILFLSQTENKKKTYDQAISFVDINDLLLNDKFLFIDSIKLEKTFDFFTFVDDNRDILNDLNNLKTNNNSQVFFFISLFILIFIFAFIIFNFKDILRKIKKL